MAQHGRTRWQITTLSRCIDERTNSAADEMEQVMVVLNLRILAEDAAFFREVLKEGRSLIVVRTESKELATSACGVLDRLGLGMQNRTPAKIPHRRYCSS